MATDRTPSSKSSSRSGSKRSASSAEQYTRPELRERVKAKVMAGNKGGRPGQWSARKAQLVAAEYERSGGAYKHPRDKAQQHLHEWTEEHWTTADGKPAKRGTTMKRYLPEEAWKKLTPAQRRATDAKKVEGSRSGKQFVANTSAAASARRAAAKHASGAKPQSQAKRTVASSSRTRSQTRSRKST